ncbi:MAG: ribonuclease P protein component [Candidatus Paceibacterota bacterium]
MLKKANRLTSALFTKYFKQGKRVNGEYLTVIKHNYTTFLAAVVVGRKVSKWAVKRNLIRRRVYSILEEVKISMDIKNGVFIVLVKPSINNLTKKQFQKLLKEEFGRLLK